MKTYGSTIAVLLFVAFGTWAAWELIPPADQPPFPVNEEHRQFLIKQREEFLSAAKNQPAPAAPKPTADVQEKRKEIDGMTTVGPLFPGTIGTTGAGANVWVNTNNLKSSTDSSAVSTFQFIGLQTPKLSCTDFGFAIPSGATITGIEFEFNRKAGLASDVEDAEIKVVGATGTSSDAAAAGFWPTSLTSITYGGASDLWGKTWTADDVNSSSFGIEITCGNTSANPFSGASADFLTATVYYAEEEEVTDLAYRDSSDGSTSGSASSFTFTHAPLGSNRFLAVDVHIFDGSGVSVSTVVSGSTSLSLIGARSSASGDERIECWGAVAATGGSTVTVTLSGSAKAKGTSVQYNGANQTKPFEAFNSATAVNSGTGTDASVTLSVASPSCWIHGACTTDDTAITAGDTDRNNISADFGSGAIGSAANEDSDATVTPGANSLTYTAMSTTAAWAMAGYAVRPASIGSDDFPLAAATGSFTLSGGNANFVSGFGIVASTGVFTATGSAATLAAGRRGVSSPATYVLNGPAINFARSRAVAASTTTYTVGTPSAVLSHGYPMPGATGSFALSEQNADLSRTRSLASSAGLFVLTGLPANTRRTWIATSDSVAFLLSGSAATLRHGYKVVGAHATYAYSASAAALSRTREVVAETGAFVLSVRSANLLFRRRMPATAGSFTESGSAAGLLFSKSVQAATGSFGVTGNVAGLLYGRTLIAEAGNFTETAAAAGFRISRQIPAVCGSFTFTGSNSDLQASRLFGCDTGSISVTGKTVNLLRIGSFICDAGDFILTGSGANFQVIRTFRANTGVFSLTSQPIGFLRTYVVSGAATYAVYGSAAGLRAVRYLRAATGEFELDGSDIGMRRDGWLIADRGGFLETASNATLQAIRTMPASVSEFVLTDRSAGLAAARLLIANGTAFTETAHSAGLSATRYAQFNTGSFTLTANDAAVIQSRRVFAATGEFALTCNPAVLTAVVMLRGAKYDALGVAFTGFKRLNWRWPRI